MRDSVVRVGIVGAGFAGKLHAECLARVYGTRVQIAGITSRSAESRERLAEKFGATEYRDIAQMLPDVDVVIICSPPAVHYEAIEAAAMAGRGIICEKPLTGAFGPGRGDPAFLGESASKELMLQEVAGKLEGIRRAIDEHKVFFGYAENFVYAPSVQKEREIIEKSKAQILRMTGEESHNGSASAVYGIWSQSGGGSLIGKGTHPLGAMLYLKRIEGLARTGNPIRPLTVSARIHRLTRVAGYEDCGFIRTDYKDVEDYGFMHVTFEDGTVADVLTSEVVLGGIYDYVEVFANNHRSRCRISPVGLLDTFNPQADQYKDIYLLEKISTSEGWTPAAADDRITMGYQGELQDFFESFAAGRSPQSNLDLAIDTTLTVYAAYLSDEKKGHEVTIPLFN
jgi:predicted dehydrogenase